MEIIAIYLEAVNKSKLRQAANLPRSALYSTLKHRNPTIRALAKIMYAILIRLMRLAMCLDAHFWLSQPFNIRAELIQAKACVIH
jgi:hypothetical protein